MDRLSCRRFYGGRLPAGPQQQRTAEPLWSCQLLLVACLVLELARVGLAGRWCAQRGALLCVCVALLLLLSCCMCRRLSAWGRLRRSPPGCGVRSRCCARDAATACVCVCVLRGEAAFMHARPHRTLPDRGSGLRAHRHTPAPALFLTAECIGNCLPSVPAAAATDQWQRNTSTNF